MIKVDGKMIPWKEGMTIRDLLDKLDDPYPYAVVRIKNRHITRPDFEKTIIPDNIEVFLIQLMAGG